MSSLEEIRAERLKKLQLLKDQGINPYPSEVNRTHEIEDVLTSFSTLETNKSIVSQQPFLPQFLQLRCVRRHQYQNHYDE